MLITIMRHIFIRQCPLPTHLNYVAILEQLQFIF